MNICPTLSKLKCATPHLGLSWSGFCFGSSEPSRNFYPRLRSVEVMRVTYLLAIFLLTATLLVLSPASSSAQGQAGAGGSVPADAVGGASLIFRKPLNPALHSGDRQSTRLNSSHITISYAVF